MHKKRPKFCIHCRVSKAKFYLYHSTKIANARPRFDEGIFDSYVHRIVWSLAFRNSNAQNLVSLLKIKSVSQISNHLFKTPLHINIKKLWKREFLQIGLAIIECDLKNKGVLPFESNSTIIYHGFYLLLTDHLILWTLVGQPLPTMNWEEITIWTSPLEYSVPLIRECLSSSFKEKM